MAVHREFATAAHAHGVLVCLNAAPARALDPELVPCIDVLVVNAVEARDMCGIKVNDLAAAELAAKALAATFPKVVVTAGEHGVAFSEKGQSAVLPAKKVTLVSTHGAGDCFVGVLCQSLVQGNTLGAAIALANEAAAEHVSREDSFFP